MNKLTLSIITALMTLAIASEARAASFGYWLAYCAGGSDEVDATIKKDSLKTCGLDEGVQSACSVLSGTPWTCSTPMAKPKEMELCDQAMLNFSIGGGFQMPAGWKIKGETMASFRRQAQKSNINTCSTSPVIPTPNATGGEFSAESGDISFVIEFRVKGDITLETPVPGTSVNVTAAAGCSRSTQAHYFKKASTNSCGTPTPSPTAQPTTSPTTSPTAPPTSPTPGSTPNPTPGSTPNPTPGSTPNPTPGSTPNPTPGSTPNPTPGSTPNPTPGSTPSPTASATPNPTPFSTPNPTPFATPFATPFPTPFHTPAATGG